MIQQEYDYSKPETPPSQPYADMFGGYLEIVNLSLGCGVA
jgi:hypothetical protein